MAKNDVKFVLTYAEQILFLVTGKTFKINHKLNYDDKCLVYLFACKYCGKQYVGKLLRSLGLGRITINVMIGNILVMRIVFRDIYLDIFLVGNMQVSLKMSLGL